MMSEEEYEEYQEMLDEEAFWWRVENGEIEEYGNDDGTSYWAEVIYTNSETGKKFKLFHGEVIPYVNCWGINGSDRKSMRRYVEVHEE